MKKYLVLPIFSAMLALTSCVMYNGIPQDSGSSSQSSSKSKTTSSSTHFDPGPGGENITFLVLTPIGQINGQSGEDFPELHLTNTIKYTSNVGEALPGADQITVTSGTGVFDSWVYYDTLTNPGAPTKISEVPNVYGMVLYAKFKNGQNPYKPPELGTEVTYYFTNNWKWSALNVYMWKDDETGQPEAKKAWPGEALTYDSTNPFDEDIYRFTIHYGDYEHFIINGKSDQGSDIQTVDLSFASFGGSNAIYCKSMTGNKVDVEFWKK